MASYAFEFKKRVDNVPELENYMGVPFTVGRYCVRALRRTSPELVQWDDVHKRVITDSIGKHGQDPEDVYDAIAEHSPGAITPEQQERVRKMIDVAGPALEDRYDEMRNREDREYHKQKEANGGEIKFVQGPSEDELLKRVYGD